MILVLGNCQMDRVAAELSERSIANVFMSLQTPDVFNEYVFQSDPVHDTIYEELNLGLDELHNKYNLKPYINHPIGSFKAVIVNTFHVRKLLVHEHKKLRYRVSLSPDSENARLKRYLRGSFTPIEVEENYAKSFISMLDRLNSIFPTEKILLVECASPSDSLQPYPYSYLYDGSRLNPHDVAPLFPYARKLGIKCLSMDNLFSQMHDTFGIQADAAYPYFLYKNGIRRDITHLSPLFSKILTDAMLRYLGIDWPGPSALTAQSAHEITIDLDKAFLSKSPTEISVAVYHMLKHGIGPGILLEHKEAVPLHEYLLRTIRLYNTVTRHPSLSAFFRYQLGVLENDTTLDELFKRKYKSVLLQELARGAAGRA